MKIKDSIILITGGASGIGRIMGRVALERGADYIFGEIFGIYHAKDHFTGRKK